VTDRYKVEGDGPYFVKDVETGHLACTIGFTTEAEAQALIDLLTQGKKGLKDER
jgi:hypothetical protein